MWGGPRRYPSASTVRISPEDVEDAADWLEELLEHGPMYNLEIKQRAKAAGIHYAALQDAQQALRVKAFNVNDENTLARHKVWFWALPHQYEE